MIRTRDDELRELAEAHIRNFRGKPEDSGDTWSLLEINGLVEHAPDEALVVIEHFATLAESARELNFLGAGMVEDLLSFHGAEVIDRLLSTAHRNPAVSRALRAVVKTTRMSDLVWNRLCEYVKAHHEGSERGRWDQQPS